MSWSWRKILQLRPLVRNFIWYKLGDGSKALAWFDSWCSLSPLANIVSSRDVHRAGLYPTKTVRDIITPNGWAWPSDWVDYQPPMRIKDYTHTTNRPCYGTIINPPASS
ncbi:reverse transcriptase domain, Reverse transcriptase zinc-binding domain protein [Artemisia annua]|uniref:Reverse transcriptase domain, Reverse transcriptase zinc-binding domain protein n=1 Tax=Artemisia annua TaxID=35608 RepID=A0A2U1LTC8_ARTAN|nr:reverse transcriptase domain, Reverse transcriptase zinc-binding domain protein [Artemisia annua]